MTVRAAKRTATSERVVTIQPASRPGHTAPPPFQIGAYGRVGRQDLWRGDPAVLAGFQRDLTVQRLDLLWEEFDQAPEAAIGMYPVFRRADGTMAALPVPIETVTATGAPVAIDD